LTYLNLLTYLLADKLAYLLDRLVKAAKAVKEAVERAAKVARLRVLREPA
jgi:hypothetical protein